MEINETVIDNYISNIEKTTDCSKLAELLEDVENFLGKSIESALESISELQTLITVPTDLSSVIDWISSCINNYYKPYSKAILAQVALVEKYTELLNAVQNKSASLQCNLTLPEIPEVPEII